MSVVSSRERLMSAVFTLLSGVVLTGACDPGSDANGSDAVVFEGARVIVFLRICGGWRWTGRGYVDAFWGRVGRRGCMDANARRSASSPPGRSPSIAPDASTARANLSP